MHDFDAWLESNGRFTGGDGLESPACASFSVSSLFSRILLCESRQPLIAMTGDGVFVYPLLACLRTYFPLWWECLVRCLFWRRTYLLEVIHWK